MSQPPGSLPLRGAVDLAALAAQNQRREQVANAPAGAPSPLVVDVGEAEFQQVVEESVSVPVVVELWAGRAGRESQLSPELERLATTDHAGRFLLARVDVDANPRLAQAFQAQQVPMTVAILKGQPVPLYTGVVPDQQVQAYVEELLRVAEANGVTGRLDAGGAAEPAEEAAEEELPPLHQAAYDAIERDDLDAAAAAYRQALAESPADALAKAGLAQVELMRRTRGADLDAARQAAADAPQDVDAQLLVADLDVLGGHVEDAFARLVDTVRVTGGEDRERVRAHLVELFEVVGSDDERVQRARRSLMSALF